MLAEKRKRRRAASKQMLYDPQIFQLDFYSPLHLRLLVYAHLHSVCTVAEANLANLVAIMNSGGLGGLMDSAFHSLKSVQCKQLVTPEVSRLVTRIRTRHFSCSWHRANRELVLLIENLELLSILRRGSRMLVLGICQDRATRRGSELISGYRASNAELLFCLSTSTIPRMSQIPHCRECGTLPNNSSKQPMFRPKTTTE